MSLYMYVYDLIVYLVLLVYIGGFPLFQWAPSKAKGSPALVWACLLRANAQRSREARPSSAGGPYRALLELELPRGRWRVRLRCPAVGACVVLWLYGLVLGLLHPLAGTPRPGAGAAYLLLGVVACVRVRRERGGAPCAKS